MSPFVFLVSMLSIVQDFRSNEVSDNFDHSIDRLSILYYLVLSRTNYKIFPSATLNMIQTSIDTIGLYYFFILESNKEQLLDKRISQEVNKT